MKRKRPEPPTTEMTTGGQRDAQVAWQVARAAKFRERQKEMRQEMGATGKPTVFLCPIAGCGLLVGRNGMKCPGHQSSVGEEAMFRAFGKMGKSAMTTEYDWSTIPTPPPKPIVATRDWQSILRDTEGGLYDEIIRATNGLSDLTAEAKIRKAERIIIGDVTGTQELEIQSIPLTDDELRRSDEAVAHILDRAITKTVTAQAMEMLEHRNVTSGWTVGDAIADVLDEHALYPVVYVQSGPALGVDGTHFLRYAIGWLYEEALDEEDEDE